MIAFHVFLDDVTARYLHLSRAALHASRCQLLAYVLMDNHVHLHTTPPQAGRITQLMQRLCRHYVAISHLIDNPVAYRCSNRPADLGQRGYSALTPHPPWLEME
ncbi:transposase [Xanthomonas sacchari]|uniref:transposase n=1 Tax=Xanthomonas sacchari TaxID=56458 RepID=UPI002257097B|nr:transposase [Xanthomonas sacchari]